MKRHPRPDGIRETILREWRGCDEAPDLAAGIHRAQEFISAILRASGAEDGLHEDEVRNAWKELAGDFVAKHSAPLSVKNGQLVLRVNQPAMRFHLEQMKPMLLERIQSRLGKDRIRSITFSHG